MPTFADQLLQTVDQAPPAGDTAWERLLRSLVEQPGTASAAQKPPPGSEMATPGSNMPFQGLPIPSQGSPLETLMKRAAGGPNQVVRGIGGVP